ncbi:DUF4192 family protein [Demequina aurantiaca]|uniref:DUF4192 family protein n=1 Tax=Demequina aurantiaca TaxID=676200 RepID=UPI003D341275
MSIDISTTNQATHVATINELIGFTPKDALVVLSPTTPRAVAVIPLEDLDPERIGEALEVALSLWKPAIPRDVVTVYFSGLPEASFRHLDDALRVQYDAYSIRNTGTFYIAPQDATGASTGALVAPASGSARERAQEAHNAAEPDFSEYLRGLDHAHYGGLVPASIVGAAARCLAVIEMRDMACVLMTGTELPQECIDGIKPLDATVAGLAMDRIVDPELAWKPSEGLATHVELLTALVAHMPPEACAPARTLLGLAAWWSGDNTLALDHLHYALKADPDYRLARLVTATIHMVVEPGWLAASATSHASSPQR